MDAPSLGVLRDVTLLVWLALLIGVAAYKWVRQTRPSSCWNWDGRVDARPFLPVDGIVVAALSILLLSGLQQAAPATAESLAAKTDMELNSGAVFLSILMQLIICAVLLFYLRAVRALNPVELFGFPNRSLAGACGSAAIFMIPTFMIVMSVSAGVHHWLQGFWPEMGAQQSVEAFRRSNDPVAKALLVIAAAVVAPIVEETMFRGFIYGVIKRFTDRWFAALCSAILFAVVHFHVGSMIPLGVLALILCAAYELTGSLAVPMVMHGLFNGTSIALMIFFPEMSDANPG